MRDIIKKKKQLFWNYNFDSLHKEYQYLYFWSYSRFGSTKEHYWKNTFLRRIFDVNPHTIFLVCQFYKYKIFNEDGFIKIILEW